MEKYSGFLIAIGGTSHQYLWKYGLSPSPKQ
jgi:hypothetical protein